MELEPDLLELHQKNECTMRMQPCIFCQMNVPVLELKEHETYCGAKSVPCELCQKPVPRKRMVIHLATDHGVNPSLPPSARRGAGAGASHGPPPSFVSRPNVPTPGSAFGRGMSIDTPPGFDRDKEQREREEEQLRRVLDESRVGMAGEDEIALQRALAASVGGGMSDFGDLGLGAGLGGGVGTSASTGLAGGRERPPQDSKYNPSASSAPSGSSGGNGASSGTARSSAPASSLSSMSHARRPSVDDVVMSDRGSASSGAGAGHGAGPRPSPSPSPPAAASRGPASSPSASVASNPFAQECPYCQAVFPSYDDYITHLAVCPEVK